MTSNIYIHLLREFSISADGKPLFLPLYKSRKGISLIELLILNCGQTVSYTKLIDELWFDPDAVNPQNAMKALVSRTRKQLEQCSPGLGSCIVTDDGGYSWHGRPDLFTDVEELLSLLSGLSMNPSISRRNYLTEKLIRIYTGDLVLTGDMKSGASACAWFHKEYLRYVYLYLDSLFYQKNYTAVCRICRAALCIDELDDRLNQDLMRGMALLGKKKEVLQEYRRVRKIYRKHLDIEPSEDIQSLYRQIRQNPKQLIC